MKKLLLISLIILSISCFDNQKKESEPKKKITETYQISYDKTKVVEYSIENTEYSSMKAIIENLSKYTTSELESLPSSKRQISTVIVPTNISKENLDNTLKQIVDNITKANNDIDEIIIFAYDDIKDIGSFYTFGKLIWAPFGELGNITPNIAKNNIRNDYRFKIDIKDKVGNINKTDIPTKKELDVYYMIMDEKYIGYPEKKLNQMVIKRFNLKGEKELNKIWAKVAAYKM